MPTRNSRMPTMGMASRPCSSIWFASEMMRMRLGWRSTRPMANRMAPRSSMRSRACRPPWNIASPRPATTSIRLKRGARRHRRRLAGLHDAGQQGLVPRLGAADVDGDAGRPQLALGARDQPGPGGVEGGQVGQHDQHLLGPGGLQRPQPFVERARRLDRPRAAGGKNDVLAPPRGFHQPCRHRTRILPSHPLLCNTPAAGCEIACPARTR